MEHGIIGTRRLEPAGLRRFLGRFSFMSDNLLRRQQSVFDPDSSCDGDMSLCHPRDATWMMEAETAAAGRQAVHTCERIRTSVASACLIRVAYRRLPAVVNMLVLQPGRTTHLLGQGAMGARHQLTSNVSVASSRPYSLDVLKQALDVVVQQAPARR